MKRLLGLLILLIPFAAAEGLLYALDGWRCVLWITGIAGVGIAASVGAAWLLHIGWRLLFHD